MDIFLGFITETKPLSDAERLVKKVGLETEKTSAKVSNLGKNMRLTKGPTSALSTTAGQLGVQFQDVAVQAQMGTDAVRIFSQQGPQILSIFGPTGAVFGALAAIGVVVGTTIAEAFSDGEEAIKSFGDATKAVNDSVNQLSDDSYGLSQSIVELAQKSDAAAKLKIAIALEAADIAARRAREAFSRLGLESQGMYREIEGADQVTRNFAVALENIKRDGEISATTMGLLNDTANQLGVSVSEITSIVDEFTRASDPNADAATLVAFGETLAELAQKADIGNSQFKEYILSLVDTALQAETTEERARLLSEAFEDLSGAVGKSDDKALSFVLRMEQMAKEAGKTREEILKLQAAQIEDPVMRARAEAAIKVIEDQRKAEEKARAESKKEDEEKRQAARDAAAEKRRIFNEDKVLRQIEREQEAEEKKAEEDRAKRIEKEKELRVKDALERMKLEKEVKENAINTAADGLKAMGQYNKRAFEASKAVETGRAVMQTYSGATKALADLPFPYNVAAAAGIVAFGLAQVAQIQSQTYQGRALGGQVRAGESYVVGERGPELLTMGANGRITPNDKLGGQQQVITRNTNVTFEISTVDAAGFSELLNSRKGQIISMINSAANDRGRRAIA